MEKESEFYSLLNDGADIQSTSASLQSQFDGLVCTFQAREAQLNGVAKNLKGKYCSLMTAAKIKSSKIVANAQETADSMLSAANSERQAWEAEKEMVAGIQTFEPRVKLDVGGVKFTTSLTTLRRFPDTMLGAMFFGRHALPKDEEGYHFIDRDGTHFRYILNFLRSPETFEVDLTKSALKELQVECDYYGLADYIIPSTPIAPVECFNRHGQSVTISQAYREAWCANGASMFICIHCFAALREGRVPKGDCEYLSRFLASKGKDLDFAAQPRQLGKCLICGRPQV